MPHVHQEGKESCLTDIMVLPGGKQSKGPGRSKTDLREQGRDWLWDFIVIWVCSCVLHGLHGLNFPPIPKESVWAF